MTMTTTRCETSWGRLDEEARGIGLLDRLLDIMTRSALRTAPAIDRKATSPSEMLVRFGALAIGARLLRADSCDSLDGALEEAVESQDFQLLLTLMESRVPASPGHAQAVPAPPVPDWFVERYGRGMATQLSEGLKLGAAISDAVRQLEVKLGRRKRRTSVPREYVLELVRKGRIHPRVSRSLISALKGVAAFYGMAESMLGDRAVDPWLKSALANAWVAGRREHLRLLASIPGIQVPPDLAPGERFDHLRLVEESNRAEEGARAFVDAARRSGKEVFTLPPSDLWE